MASVLLPWFTLSVEQIWLRWASRCLDLRAQRGDRAGRRRSALRGAATAGLGRLHGDGAIWPSAVWRPRRSSTRSSSRRPAPSTWSGLSDRRRLAEGDAQARSESSSSPSYGAFVGDRGSRGVFAFGAFMQVRAGGVKSPEIERGAGRPCRAEPADPRAASPILPPASSATWHRRRGRPGATAGSVAQPQRGYVPQAPQSRPPAAAAVCDAARSDRIRHARTANGAVSLREERTTGLEPATSSLGSLRSTN